MPRYGPVALSSTRGIGMGRRLAAVAALSLTVASCSDDGDPEAANTTDSPEHHRDGGHDAGAFDRAAAHRPAAIPPPAENSAPTTDSTTSRTAPPSPNDATVAAFNALNEARHRCWADLQACDPRDYAQLVSGDQLASAIAEVEDRRSPGYVTSNTGQMLG